MLHRTKRTPKNGSSFSQISERSIARGHSFQRLTTRALFESLEDRRLLTSVLGTASNFAVLAGSTATSTGPTVIVGNVGVSPGTSVTGFPQGTVSSGAIHAGDATATQAKADLATAYGAIAGEAVTTTLTGQNLGGLTLTPGVYRFATSAQLTGTLTLNAQGNPNARFDIQIGTTLTTASASAIVLINGAQADNVYFQVGSSATLGTSSAFEGNILAYTSVTLDSGSSIAQGRALAINGAVTMDSNHITDPNADVSVTNTTTTGPVLAGNTITYTVTIANAGSADAQTVSLSDLLPAGTTFLSDTQTSGTAFTLTNPAVGSTGTITGTTNLLPSGDSATFSVVAKVSPSTATATSLSDTADVSANTTDFALNNNTQAVTTSVQTQADIAVTNTSNNSTVTAGNTITYTVTVANAGPSDAHTVTLSDLLPANTTFVSDTQTSGPAFTLTNPAVGSAGTIDGTIGTLAANASASFTVVAMVAPSTPDGTTITSTPSVSTATTDSNIANNTASASVNVGSSVTVASLTSPLTTSSARPTLSILGADTGSQGEAGLTYTWSVGHAPSGAKAVKFSVNGTNAAKNATVRVQKAGTYLLNCLISDTAGNSATATVEMIITQVATSLRLTPHAQTIAAGASLQYGATAIDQFDHAMRTTPTTSYAMRSGGASINAAGMLTAGKFQSHLVIQIADDGLIGTLGATVL